MLRVDTSRWHQSPDDLRRLAVESAHPRTRERFLALYEVSQGRSALNWAARTDRRHSTVLEWMHTYNERGPEALIYQRTGGWTPLFSSISDCIKQLIHEATEAAAHPHGTPSVSEASSKATTQTPTEAPSMQPSEPASPKTGWIRWTSRTIRTHIEKVFGIAVSKETIRCVLHRLGLSWKKAKKLLAKANPEKRRAFVQDVWHLLDRVTHDEDLVLAYIDEAHVHQDADMGYGWSQRGHRLYVASSSPGLHAKVSFYGAYLYSESQVRIWPYERANSVHTLDVLERLRAEFPSRSMIVLWDGASYHRSAIVLEAAARLDVQIIRLPTYSPDFMPVEALWHWLRENVTYNHCHDTARELIRRVAEFVAKINRDAYGIADRLWVKDELDPEEENLRFST